MTQHRHTCHSKEKSLARSLQLGIALVTIALSACGNAASDRAATTEPAPSGSAAPVSEPAAEATPPPPTSQGTATMTDVDSFVPAGMKAMETLRGDLTGAGHSDALLIVSAPAKPGEKLGEGAPRTVVLVVQDENGDLREVARNNKIVPCARCGGLAGDPYGYARIDKAAFLISVSGGSRERWAEDYSFRYDPAQQTWLLDRVVREVTDTETDANKRTELTSKEFGSIAFASFDPASLPQAGTLQ
jgi:hypothetical protein